MRVALVHDYLNQYGGAERVLSAFCEIFPRAPIYTLVYDKALTGYAFEDRKIFTSFLQKIPFARSYHRIFPPLMPVAVEQFDLSKYDLVLSDSASYAKGIITKPSTLHICYCHTPLRYAWDDSHRYIEEFGYPRMIKKIIPFFMNYIRMWDSDAGSIRVDKFIANSGFVRERILKYYNQEAEIIYPPVRVNNFKISKDIGDYFLVVGRLLAYKRFDIAVRAFNKLGWPLKIIGGGPEEKKLKKIANANIEFIGLVSDDKLTEYYRNARALIFPQEEDFGITMLESMASGRPVIAFRRGGALEVVRDRKNGIFFTKQTPNSLIKALEKFQKLYFDSDYIRETVLDFDIENFKKSVKEFISQSWQEFNARKHNLLLYQD